MSSNTIVTWTDFNQSDRVHILSVHNSIRTANDTKKRFGKIYPNLTISYCPDHFKVKSGENFYNKDAEIIREGIIE